MKKYLQLFTILSLVWCSALSAQKDSGITFHESHEEKKRSAPYSDAVEAGNLFFLAGQIGMDHTTRTMVVHLELKRKLNRQLRIYRQY